MNSTDGMADAGIRRSIGGTMHKAKAGNPSRETSGQTMAAKGGMAE